jgi:hypothetical protein
MRGLLEVLVHLESFRNIDIAYQGLYYIEVKLFHRIDQFTAMRLKKAQGQPQD